jgi:hypothetical protein
MWFPDAASPANQFFADTQGNLSKVIEWLRNKTSPTCVWPYP